MPIYEYRCEACSHQLEAMQKFSDPVLTECPACGKAALVKLVSAAGFQLKGSGWYATDFKGSKKPASAEKTSESSESSSTSSTDTKKTGCGSGGCGHNH